MTLAERICCERLYGLQVFLTPNFGIQTLDKTVRQSLVFKVSNVWLEKLAKFEIQNFNFHRQTWLTVLALLSNGFSICSLGLELFARDSNKSKAWTRAASFVQQAAHVSVRKSRAVSVYFREDSRSIRLYSGGYKLPNTLCRLPARKSTIFRLNFSGNRTAQPSLADCGNVKYRNSQMLMSVFHAAAFERS